MQMVAASTEQGWKLVRYKEGVDSYDPEFMSMDLDEVRALEHKYAQYERDRRVSHTHSAAHDGRRGRGRGRGRGGHSYDRSPLRKEARGDKEKRLQEVVCWGCQEKGHYAHACPKAGGSRGKRS